MLYNDIGQLSDFNHHAKSIIIFGSFLKGLFLKLVAQDLNLREGLMNKICNYMLKML